MTASEIADRMKGRPCTGGWEARCPAHDDKTASLSISEGRDGMTLVHCHAGCTFDDIVSAAGLEKKDFYADEPKAASKRIVAEYSYQDEDGKELFQVVRFDPKDFRQRTRNDSGGWTWSLKGITRVLYRMPAIKAARDAGKVVFVVEGEKDVAALESLGVTATCNPGGAGKWEPQYTDALAGMMVVMIPDADEAGRKHRNLVCKELDGKVKWIRVVELPVKDAALWITQGGTKQELTAMIKAASPYASGDYKDEPLNLGDMRSVTSAENGAKGGRPPAPSHADTAERYANESLIVDGHYVVRYWRGSWYAYTHGKGWRQEADSEMQGRLITFLRETPDLRGHATATYSSSVMLNLRAHDLCGLPETTEKPCWLDTGESARNWVAFSNGVCVNVWTYAQALAENRTPDNYTRPLSPEFFSSDYVEYEWNPDMHAALFHDYLDRVQPDTENTLAVCRMMGVLMADTTRFEVFWQLFGRGSNGKTVLLDVIKALVGKCNLSYVPLGNLVQRFGPWPLADSKVNICGELATDVGRGQLYQIEGEFKNAVSGGEIEYEQKNKDKFFANCRARFIMATNSLPTFVDKSDGIWRRLRVIPFREQIGDEEKDINLAAKIVKDEMPGVLAWALDGLADVIRSGTVGESDEGKRIKDEHRRGCDHEAQFLADNYKRGSGSHRVKASAMYAKYKEWMFSNGYKPLGAGKFYSRVSDVFPFSEVKTMRFPDGVTQGFENVAEISTQQEFIPNDVDS